jgi:hypothetical protein
MVMKLRIPQPDWTGAKCLDFVPTREYDAFVDDDMDEAVAVCNGDIDGKVCPKRHECLIFALVNNEHYGVFGGLYPEQRHDLRQRFKRRKGKPAPIEWEFDNATPQQDLLDAAAAREADREALRSRAGDEAELRAAG